MARGVKAYLHAAMFEPVAIRHWRAHFGSISQRHDRKRFGRRPHSAMTAACMVRMAMGDKRAFGRTRRINPHVCRLHIDAMRMRLYPMLGGGSGDVGCPFRNQDMGSGRRDVNSMYQRKFMATGG